MKKAIRDEMLGVLEWNEEYKEWNGKITLPNDLTADFTVDLADDEVPFKVRQTVEFIKNQEESIRKKIAEQMLSLHNKDWNPTAPTTAEEFARRINLDGFNLSAEDGCAELFYNDDDLFWGHSITVFVNPNGEITSPNLAG